MRREKNREKNTFFIADIYLLECGSTGKTDARNAGGKRFGTN
jgi:hypothetical protein